MSGSPFSPHHHRGGGWRPGSAADLFAVTVFHLIYGRSIALVTPDPDSPTDCDLAVVYAPAYEGSAIDSKGSLRLGDLVSRN